MRLADAAAESFETAGDLRNACLQRVSVGYAYNEIGAYAEAERALRGAITMAERLGLDNAVGTARAQLGRTLGRTRRLEEAREVLGRAIDSLKAQKNMRLAAVATRYRAHVLGAMGDAEGAEREAQAAAEGLAGATAMVGDALAMLADAQRARGATSDALETAKRAMAALESAGKTAIGRGGDPLGPRAGPRGDRRQGKRPRGPCRCQGPCLGAGQDNPRCRAARRAFVEGVAEHARPAALVLE